MKNIASILILAILFSSIFSVYTQQKQDIPTFKKIKIVKQDGDKIYQKSVIVTFLENKMTIKSKDGISEKNFSYSDIKRAEYSYSKNPRWKTGLGLGAASIVFPPLFLVAIPIGFTKHRRHWLTIRTEDDYAVLKLSKSNRKIFMPTFETKSGITIKAIGNEK